MAPHGKNPLEDLDPELLVRHRGRGEIDLHGVLTPRLDFSKMSSGRVPGEVSHTMQAMGVLNVQALEGPGGDPAGGPSPLAKVNKLRHAKSTGIDGPAPMYIQVQLGNRYATAAVRR